MHRRLSGPTTHRRSAAEGSAAHTVDDYDTQIGWRVKSWI